MIPLRDVIPSRTTPWMTMALIGVNVAVFIHELMLPERGLRAFYEHYGLVPANFTWLTAVTAMFIHSGWLHLGGNLWSLWIFGDNVEDQLGHVRYLVFYLITGLAANLAQTYAAPGSMLPLVGASGAIAGVMGAYLVLFPRSRILVLIPLIIFMDIVEVPAVFFLVFWFLMQLVSGVGSLADSHATGGVAFWAHAGGFVTGAMTVLVFRRRRQPIAWDA